MSALEEKRCSRCKRRLPLDAFDRSRRERDGLQQWCKRCKAAYRRERSTPRAPATHCLRGHRLDAGNVYVIPSSGKRQCLICKQRRSRQRNRRLLAARRKASTLRRCVICRRRLPPGLRIDAQTCGQPTCVRARRRRTARREQGRF